MTLETEFTDFVIDAGKIAGQDEITSKIIALLFLEKELSLDEIAKRTGYSLPSISNKAKILEMFKVLKKSRKPNSKKIYLNMDKDVMNMFHENMMKIHNAKINLAKERLPNIITKYKTKAKTEKEKEKIKIIEDHMKIVKKFEKMLNHMKEFVENEK